MNNLCYISLFDLNYYFHFDMTTLPKLVSEIIDWYQWKAKIRLVNKKYHSSYMYNETKGFLVCVYLDFSQYEHSIHYRPVNYRKIGYHDNYEDCPGFYSVKPIKLYKQSRHKYNFRLPPAYCHCKLCEDHQKELKN